MNTQKITNQTFEGNVKFMTPSKLAKCFGVSYPTFMRWLAILYFEEPNSVIKFIEPKWSSYDSYERSRPRFKWMFRIVSPEEVRIICKLLGDPECTLKFNKSSVSSLAKEAGIGLKTAYRLIDQYERNHQDKKLNAYHDIKCLMPRSSIVIRKILGISVTR